MFCCILVLLITWCNADIVELPPEELVLWQKTGNCKGAGWHEQNDIWSRCQEETLPNNCNLTTSKWKTHPANRVTINITLSTNKNSKNMTLLIFTGSSDPISSHVLPANLTENKTVESSVFTINDMGSKQFIYLSFVNTNTYCGVISKVVVSYIKCPKATGELVKFVTVPAPDQLTQTTRIFGNCTDNAVLDGSNTPYMDCKYDGTFEVHGQCFCDRGYTKSDKVCEGTVYIFFYNY